MLYQDSDHKIVLQGLSTLQQVAQAQAPAVKGYFAGTVAISDPIALGSLDLAFNLNSQGNQIAGTVDVSRTQAFGGAGQLRGSITGANGVTPTFQLAAQPFVSTISGRQVTRSFELIGEIGADETMRGSYVETIQGFTPKPLVVKGSFLLVRSYRSTASGGPPPVPPFGDGKIYMPLIGR